MTLCVCKVRYGWNCVIVYVLYLYLSISIYLSIYIPVHTHTVIHVTGTHVYTCYTVYTCIPGNIQVYTCARLPRRRLWCSVCCDGSWLVVGGL